MYYYKECHECGSLYLLNIDCETREKAYEWGKQKTICPKCGASLFESNYFSTRHGRYTDYLGTPEDYEKRLFLRYISGNPDRESKYYRRLDADREDRYNCYIDHKAESERRESDKSYHDELMNENIPHCPTCGSADVRKIDALERGVSVLTLGLFSKKINKSFKCKNCGYTW